MEQKNYPPLSALSERGPLVYEGAPLSSLLIEVRGGRLYIHVVTPLRDDGDHYIESGSEHDYILESGEAEKLLAALSGNTGKKPDQIIAREFEFSRPQCPLKEYLDDLRLTYQYHFTKGEPL